MTCLSYFWSYILRVLRNGLIQRFSNHLYLFLFCIISILIVPQREQFLFDFICIVLLSFNKIYIFCSFWTGRCEVKRGQNLSILDWKYPRFVTRMNFYKLFILYLIWVSESRDIDTQKYTKKIMFEEVLDIFIHNEKKREKSFQTWFFFCTYICVSVRLNKISMISQEWREDDDS